MWVVLSGIDAGHWMLLSAPVPIGPMDYGFRVGFGTWIGSRGTRIGTRACQLILILPGLYRKHQNLTFEGLVSIK